MKLLLAGATGLVGRHVLRLALADARVTTVVALVLPARWRINPAERIAQALLEAALLATPGVRLITSDHLT